MNYDIFPDKLRDTQGYIYKIVLSLFHCDRLWKLFFLFLWIFQYNYVHNLLNYNHNVKGSNSKFINIIVQLHPQHRQK